MQEQERIANEEAEKRLKAALTAKREPGVTASRVASPVVGNPATPESTDPKPSSADEVESSMDVDSAVIPPPPPQRDDVRSIAYSSSSPHGFLPEHLASRTCGLI
jgi:THO complex subunit 2